MHHPGDLGEVAAALVEEEAAVAAIAAAGRVAYPMLAAADETAAIVPGLVLVLGDGIDLNIQHSALMTEVAVALATEIEGLALECLHIEGEIEHETDMVA